MKRPETSERPDFLGSRDPQLFLTLCEQITVLTPGPVNIDKQLGGRGEKQASPVPVQGTSGIPTVHQVSRGGAATHIMQIVLPCPEPWAPTPVRPTL